ncbi:MAG: di-trans,poly-cis-decaprenylcistransferase [Rikenellaceae bacterium]|nr:di-trans,poly-cis-decaprenylcistransferase [Rikenellaceae bacterium]
MTDTTRTPRHVAIIMDGNGRWAQQHGKERVFGHARGVESVRGAVKAAIRNGVGYLTIYAFSTENWGRPTEEIDALMELFCKSIAAEAPELRRQGVSLHIIGDTQGLSPEVREHIALAEQQTADGDKLVLIVALNYSSRWELTEAARAIAREASAGTLDPDAVTAETVGARLATAAWPDPDLLIRTSGECRLSNFLLWQLAYSELYFTEVLWPDFDEREFDKALDNYRQRDRRFGLIKN